jgi:hypothetical protein
VKNRAGEEQGRAGQGRACITQKRKEMKAKKRKEKKGKERTSKGA